MNLPTDFDPMTLAELEAERDKLARERETLESNRQASETELQAATDARQNLLGETESLIEQLVPALVPDLSAQTLYKLQQFFPGEPNLSEKPAEATERKTLWQQIVGIFAGSTANRQLEQRRVLLRGALWSLSAVPNRSLNRADQFAALVEKKQEFNRREAIVAEAEARANEFEQKSNELAARLAACEEAIARRKNAQQADADKDDFNQTSSNQSSFDSGFASSAVLSDSSTVSDSALESGAAADDFSFGGGGDAGGGGAGGSWENYS